MSSTNAAVRVQASNGVRRRRFPGFLVWTLSLCLVALHCGSGPEERRLAIYDLKSEPTEANLGKIRPLLDDPDRDVRATALNALVGLDAPDSGEIALRALGDADGFVRATAAKLLGDLDDRAYVTPLAAVLEEDPDAVARQRAAETLSRLGGDEAAQALARGLADPMERVRMAAVKGVAKLGPALARDRLVSLLQEDAVWEIRAEAAHALGLTGDPEIRAALEAGLSDPNEFVRSAVSNALRLHAEVAQARSAPQP